MPQVHRHGDQRNCKATTIVSGQNAVYANNVLVSVLGDKNTHGGGELEATVNPGTIWINNKEMVVVGSEAKIDGLLHVAGGDGASTGSTNIWAFEGSDGTEENAVSCENEPVQLADPEKETYTPINALPMGAENPPPQVQPQENGGPHAKPNPEHTAGAAQAGKDATVKGETVPGTSSLTENFTLTEHDRGLAGSLSASSANFIRKEKGGIFSSVLACSHPAEYDRNFLS